MEESGLPQGYNNIQVWMLFLTVKLLTATVIFIEVQGSIERAVWCELPVPAVTFPLPPIHGGSLLPAQPQVREAPQHPQQPPAPPGCAPRAPGSCPACDRGIRQLLL